MTERGLARFTTPGPTRRIVDRDAPSDTDASDTATSDTVGSTHTGGRTGAGAHPSHPSETLAPPLAQLIGTRRPPAPGESCELCAAPVPDDDHRHVVDLERRALLCSCRGCALLFEFSTAGDHRYRAVPDRYAAIVPFSLPPQAWAALQIPVGIAFVVANSKLDATVAFYPSPGGATESELPLDAWDEIVAANPGIARAQPDIEAVLIRTDEKRPTCHIVPVDRCYELVGALRLHWRGFDGGSEVREHITAFFSDVERLSTRRGSAASDREPTHPPRSSAAAPRRSPGDAAIEHAEMRSRTGGGGTG